CAFGTFLRSLGPGWEVCGSDPSAFAIARARELCPDGDFRVGSATDGAPEGGADPLFPGRFGVVTAFDVVQHVPALDGVASSVNAQLADGGLFVFVVPVYDGLSGPVIRALDRDPTHVHKWPRRRWLAWAGRHFGLLDWSGTLRYLLPGVKYYVHLPTRL